VKQAQKKFRDWMDKGARIPPNLREVVYMAGKKYVISNNVVCLKVKSLSAISVCAMHYERIKLQLYSMVIAEMWEKLSAYAKQVLFQIP
jgi:hypothetical protein